MQQETISFIVRVIKQRNEVSLSRHRERQSTVVIQAGLLMPFMLECWVRLRVRVRVRDEQWVTSHQ